MRIRPLLLMIALGLGGCASDGAVAQTSGASDWAFIARADSGIDQSSLEQLSRDIEAGEYSNIHSIVVVRHGALAYEDYFSGADERRGAPVGVVAFDANTLHDARSVTKSVVSLLFGVAVREGRIADLDTPVLDYFPEYADLRTPERLAITLRHVLSMTSGFAWDESSRPYGDPANDETRMDGATDPYRYVLERPIAHPPGTQFEYSGGDTMLLAGVLEQATGARLEDYARDELFAPLGVTEFELMHYPNGNPIAASGLRLRPRDMAKVGLLALNGGRWGETQIVSEDWTREALSPHAAVSPRPLGLRSYGYQWWLGMARVEGEFVPYSAAVGWGGQRVLLIPSRDAVIVVTAGLYGDPRQTDITFEIMLDRVLPALR